MKAQFGSQTRIVALALSALLVAGLVACSTGSDSRRTTERGPDVVMGSPPPESSEDYEFAPPPRHPGAHGDVSRNQQPRAQERQRPEGVIFRDDIRRLRNFGPSLVLEHVDTDPRHEDGRFVGFRIVDVSERAHHYISPQLRVGDVITHINLVRLQRPDDYLEAWNTLEDVDEIRIDFLRDGEAGHALWSVE